MTSTTRTRKFADDYSLVAEIGSGSFSKVYEGICRKTEEKCAIKVIERQGLTEAELDSIQNEIQLLSTIEHENVLKYYDHYLEVDKVYIVTEYCAGGELFGRITARMFYPEPEAQKVLKEIAKALKYCHERNIVHRDLKPENILFVSKAEDSGLRLADFGFAKQIKGVQLQTALGTVSYIAPEILRGESYDASVDMWSFGVIAYVLLVGYVPFPGKDPVEVFQYIKEGRYEFDAGYWNGISEEARDLITKLLVSEPASRLTIRDVMEHPWMTNVYKEVTPEVNELRGMQTRRNLRREAGNEAENLAKARYAAQNPNAA